MVKCLLCKHKVLSSDPQTPYKIKSCTRQQEAVTWGRAEGNKRLLRAHW